MLSLSLVSSRVGTAARRAYCTAAYRSCSFELRQSLYRTLARDGVEARRRRRRHHSLAWPWWLCWLLR